MCGFDLKTKAFLIVQPKKLLRKAVFPTKSIPDATFLILTPTELEHGPHSTALQAEAFSEPSVPSIIGLIYTPRATGLLSWGWFVQ